jgi:hypothetical protein
MDKDFRSPLEINQVEMLPTIHTLGSTANTQVLFTPIARLDSRVGGFLLSVEEIIGTTCAKEGSASGSQFRWNHMSDSLVHCPLWVDSLHGVHAFPLKTHMR